MSILISIFVIFVFITSVSANYYYEYADPWYDTEFFDMNSNYYEDSDSNQVTIEFFEKGESSYIDVYVPQNDYNLQNEIYECIVDQTYDSNANITTLKNDNSILYEKNHHFDCVNSYASLRTYIVRAGIYY